MRIHSPMKSASLSTSVALAIALSAGMAFAQAPAPNQSAPNQSQPQVGISPDATQSAAPSAQNAPQGKHAAPDPARAARRLGKQLSLTRDQVAQIQPIIANRQQQMAGIRADTTLKPKDRGAKVRGILQDSNNQIEALLTDSQKQQYEQMLADRRAQKQKPQAQ